MYNFFVRSNTRNSNGAKKKYIVLPKTNRVQDFPSRFQRKTEYKDTLYAENLDYSAMSNLKKK